MSPVKPGTSVLEFDVAGITRRYGAVSVRRIQGPAVRVSELIGESMVLPVRYLNLKRMIGGTQRTVIEIHRRELRVEDEEILGKPFCVYKPPPPTPATLVVSKKFASWPTLPLASINRVLEF